ncbi:phenylalanine--tRNA ligase subunit alpha, partial [Rhizobium ruizarguesonis]
GKKGSVSELLKTLGSMTPEERQNKGAAINFLKNAVTESLTARKTTLRQEGIRPRSAGEERTGRLTSTVSAFSRESIAACRSVVLRAVS